jgi:hypothetical protein
LPGQKDRSDLFTVTNVCDNRGVLGSAYGANYAHAYAT